MSKTDSVAGGIGMTSIVFIIFLILKLAEIGIVKNWDWWWVFAPIWIPIGFVVIFVLVVIIGSFIYTMFKKKPYKF